MGLVIDALAPTFNGQKNQPNALKLAVYSMTPAWLAGIFSLIPGFRVLGIVGLYGLYLLWVGLPPLMKSPEEKSIGYGTPLITRLKCYRTAQIALAGLPPFVRACVPLPPPARARPFPAEFPLANRDWFECRQRPVRVRRCGQRLGPRRRSATAVIDSGLSRSARPRSASPALRAAARRP